MANSLGSLVIDIKSDTTQLIQGFNRAEQAVNKTTKQMSYAVKGLIGAFVGLNALDVGKNLQKQLDILTSANNKLKLVTKTTEEYTNAQKELFRVAQLTSQGYGETVTLYSKLSNSMTKMGKSQSDIIRTVETVNKAISISGSTAQEAAAAVLQLGQAFGSGRLQGDELKSITENAQGLAQAIADGMGVALGDLKELGSQGKITSEILAEALDRVANNIDSKYGKIQKTIEMTMTNISNSVRAMIGEFDQMTGLSSKISNTFLDISKAIDTINGDKLENLIDTIKIGTTTFLVSAAAIKGMTLAYGAYSKITEYNNKINKHSIDLENSKLKAYSDGMRSVMARKVAEEALNTGMVNGTVLKDKQIKQLQREASTLENVAKRQMAYSYELEATSKRFNLATAAASTFRGVLNTIPFALVATGISLIASSLLTASKDSDKLTDSLSKTKEELEKLTKNQLAYRKELLQTELIQARLDLANAKADTATKGIFENEKDRKEDLAYLDEKRQRFEELSKTIKNITEIQEKSKSTQNLILPTTPTKQFDTLKDEVKNIIAPIDVITEKYGELYKNLIDSGKATAENMALITSKMNEEIENVDKEAVEKRKESEKEKLKAIEDSEKRRKDLIKEATDLTVSEVDKINAKYVEMYEVSKATFSAEQMISFNESWQESIDKANGTLDAQKEKQELVNAALEASTSEYDKVIAKYVEMYDVIKDNPLWDYEKQNTFFENLNKDLDNLKEKLDFSGTIQLDTIGDDKSVQRIEKSFQDLQKATKKYEENRTKIAKNSKEEAENEEMYRKDQMNGYINMAGALGSMFKEGSKDAAAFQIAQTSLALVEGTRAILTAGTGDPYTAIPRMAAMAVMVKSLLGNIGVLLGGGGEKISMDSFSAQAENKGVGSVLGSDKGSESIKKSLNILEDYAKPEFRLSQQMAKSLESIDSKIGGVTSLLIRQGGFAFGEGFTGFNTGMKNNISLNSGIIGAINPLTLTDKLFDKIGLGFLSGISSGIVNKALGSVFGKTSVKQTMTDYGINFNEVLLGTAIDSITGQSYQTIKTTTKKKSLFGSSSSSKVRTYYDSLDNEIEQQFSLILEYFYDTTLTATKALNENAQAVQQTLNSFVVDIGKISLKDKTGEQIEEQISNIFGKIGDDIAKTVFPSLEPFQRVGEGLFETMTRVANGMEVATYYANMLGNSFEVTNYKDIKDKQGDVAFESLKQTILNQERSLLGYYDFVMKSTGRLQANAMATYLNAVQEGVNARVIELSANSFIIRRDVYNYNKNFIEIINGLSGSAEDLYESYLTLSAIRSKIKFLENEDDSLSLSMIRGGGGIESLSDSISYYMENFVSESDYMRFQVAELSREFGKFGIALPKSKDGFTALLNGIDLTTEAGQELYGRMIGLSESFDAVFGKSETNIKNFVDSLKTQDQLANDLAKSLGVTLANNVSDLALLFKRLATDANGLTDAEVQLLELNKALLESTDKYTVQIESLDKKYKTATDSISSLNSVLGGITNTIEKLENASTSGDFQLQKYYQSIEESLELRDSSEYDKFIASVNESIKYSDALFEIANFNSENDMRFAQAVAANQFKNLEDYTVTEIDLLQIIADNTKAQIDILKESGKSVSEPLFNLIKQYNYGTIPQNLIGFDTGGYTGNVGEKTVAGLVHGNEFVVNAKTTRNLGLNSNDGGVFMDIATEIKQMKDENREMRRLLGELVNIQNFSLESLQSLEEAI